MTIKQNADIQFTREVEEDGKLPFLDCLVSRDENTLRTAIYRKPTHTDRMGYPTTRHQTKTLTRRAQLVCNTPDSLSDENKYLRRVFDKNNYKDDFTCIRRNAHRPILLKLQKRTPSHSYDYSDYCDYTADPTIQQHPGSPQTYHYTTTLFTD